MGWLRPGQHSHIATTEANRRRRQRPKAGLDGRLVARNTRRLSIHGLGYLRAMSFLLWILAVVLVVAGIVSIVMGLGVLSFAANLWLNGFPEMTKKTAGTLDPAISPARG